MEVAGWRVLGYRSRSAHGSKKDDPAVWAMDEADVKKTVKEFWETLRSGSGILQSSGK